ncbi:hypothetical protein [Baekduia sp. Peel2402]|uniref:hypothetical protein n=1 Tax=Baekduia sp. Peel2402 TaxID=3458296 RepID=UPI00403ED970
MYALVLREYDRSAMARLTVSYSIAFIPGLPRPLVLSEVIDDVLGLSSFSSRHSVRKTPGTPDRLDIIVPVDDLQIALDSAAKAADELTRIGESLLGLGFVVEERAIRIEGLTDHWVPDTFEGAGTRHHASTHLDAAAPLPDHLEEPTGDVPDEDLRLDKLGDSPAADQSFRPLTIPDHLAPLPITEADPFSAAEEADQPSLAPRAQQSPFASPRDVVASDRDDEPAAAFALLPSVSRPVLHHEEHAAIIRRRELVRLLTATPPVASPRAPGTTERQALGLFAVALFAVIAPWRLGVSTAAIVLLALVAAALITGAVALRPVARGFVARTAVAGTVTLAVVLAFASAYAICARDGDLRGSTSGSRSPTVGQPLSAAVSLGAAPGLRFGPGARAVVYGERLLLLLALAGMGAQVARTNRRG